MIRNGRKLIKEDFSYFFKGLDDKRPDVSVEVRDSVTMRSGEKEIESSPNSKFFEEIQQRT